MYVWHQTQMGDDIIHRRHKYNKYHDQSREKEKENVSMIDLFSWQSVTLFLGADYCEKLG